MTNNPMMLIGFRLGPFSRQKIIALQSELLIGPQPPPRRPGISFSDPLSITLLPIVEPVIRKFVANRPPITLKMGKSVSYVRRFDDSYTLRQSVYSDAFRELRKEFQEAVWEKRQEMEELERRRARTKGLKTEFYLAYGGSIPGKEQAMMLKDKLNERFEKEGPMVVELDAISIREHVPIHMRVGEKKSRFSSRWTDFRFEGTSDDGLLTKSTVDDAKAEWERAQHTSK